MKSNSGLIGWWRQRRARKRAHEVLKHVRRLLATHRDIMESEKISAAEKAIAEFAQAGRGTADEITKAMDRLDRSCAKLFPQQPHAQWREVIEIGLMAAVVAWGGIRTFLLQPFKIPTGSMQPTLYGELITQLKSDEQIPGMAGQVWDYVYRGRGYAEAVCLEDGVYYDDKPLRGVKIGPLDFFSKTEITLKGANDNYRTYSVTIPYDTFKRQAETRLLLRPGREFHKGESILRCTVDCGDHIFVDKVSYNFRKPSRGEVFVFETKGIKGAQTSGEFYIKRLAGVGGDLLRIQSPELYINNHRADEPGFVRVMAMKDGYQGYSNNQGWNLATPNDTFEVPRNCYFALGDNSYHSFDSRGWGPVPRENVVGKAFFVYLPLARFGRAN